MTKSDEQSKLICEAINQGLASVLSQLTKNWLDGTMEWKVVTSQMRAAIANRDALIEWAAKE